ncbi:hypothetical protein CVT24_009461 [Panaeolus cyanescens]|uniref:Uncharacterized protein n=1 Tax=Panaeolus cyanescens TaxID=181874 RepID=A0A409W3R3_9AGAR|nr:hypothetical protein CVT24_009461 [Panaeolus cyanescens]
MKLAISPLIIAAVELSLFANIGNAYFEENSFDISARNLGFETVAHANGQNVRARQYSTDHETRAWADLDASLLSTRELIEELESRLERRNHLSDAEKTEYKGLKEKEKTGITLDEKEEARYKELKAKKKAGKMAAAAIEAGSGVPIIPDPGVNSKGGRGGKL